MSAIPNENSVILIINTNQYAGNFEREMCAYVTGQVGDCGVGEEMIVDYPNDEYLFEELVLQVPDEHGCYRPCSIWYDTDIDQESYESVAIFFTDDFLPSKKERNFLEQRAREYAAKPKWNTEELEIKGFKWINHVVQVIEKEIKWKD